MIIKYFSWVKDIVGKSEEIISISSEINTPEKLIDYLIKKDVRYKYFTDLNQLAKEVDTLCVITPGGKETQKLINKEVLSNLGKNGVIINVARGSVIDQDELIYSLENNLILAAGLDVYSNEPNIPEKLINLENTVLLPHIASGTVETRNAMGQLVFDNIENYFQNKSLISEVV